MRCTVWEVIFLIAVKRASVIYTDRDGTIHHRDLFQQRDLVESYYEILWTSQSSFPIEPNGHESCIGTAFFLETRRKSRTPLYREWEWIQDNNIYSEVSRIYIHIHAHTHTYVNVFLPVQLWLVTRNVMGTLRKKWYLWL